MNLHQAQDLVETLFAAWPSAAVTDTTRQVYVQSLRDLEVAEAQRAVTKAITTSEWLPTIAKVRALAIEDRLALPTAHEAWEMVLVRSRWTPTSFDPCVECAGEGTRLYESGDDGRTREERACAVCRGRGEVPTDDPPDLPGPAQRAYDLLGGSWTVRTTTEPGILRAQFLKAYDEFRREEITAANYESLGVLPAAAKRQAALEAAR